MSKISNFTNGFEKGLVVRDRKIETMFGKPFWVGNNASLEVGEKGASDNNRGTYLQPFKNLDYAISQTEAGRNDVIYVRPGYTQTITAIDITLDIASTHIIGLGTGSSMPVLTYTNTAGEVSIAANNGTWTGFRHTASTPDVVIAIEIEDGIDNANVYGNVFDVTTTGTHEFAVCIRTNDASNFANISNNRFDMGLGNAVAAISFTKDTDSTQVLNNRVRGDYSTACIQGITTLSTKIFIDGNDLINGETGALNAQPTIQLLTGSTGVISNNLNICNVSTPTDAIVADICMLDGNKYSETVAAASVDLPLAAANEIKIAMKKDALTTLDNLFTVGVGDILVHGLWFITTTAETGGTNPVVSLILDATTSAQDFTIATGLDLASIAISDTLTFTAVGAVLVKTAGGLASPHRPFIVAPGVIETVLDSGSYSAGDGTWFMAWSPITSGATVVAAA